MTGAAEPTTPYPAVCDWSACRLWGIVDRLRWRPLLHETEAGRRDGYGAGDQRLDSLLPGRSGACALAPGRQSASSRATRQKAVQTLVSGTVSISPSCLC